MPHYTDLYSAIHKIYYTLFVFALQVYFSLAIANYVSEMPFQRGVGVDCQRLFLVSCGFSLRAPEGSGGFEVKPVGNYVYFYGPVLWGCEKVHYFQKLFFL